MLGFPRRGSTAEMTLGGHLREARRRLALAALAIVVGLVVGLVCYEPVFQFLQQPMLQILDDSDRLVAVNFAGLGSAFTVQLKVALFVGLVASAPFWLYQLWAFVRPGLLPRERGGALIFFAAAVPLFLLGVLCAWFALPPAVEVLTGFAPDFTATIVNAEVYFDFVLRMVTAFGLAFLLPIVMIGLSIMGVVASATWLRGWRWAVLLSFLFAALASPSGDVLTMTALAAPICLLYFSAVLVCRLWEWHLVRRLTRGDQSKLTAGRDTATIEAAETVAEKGL